MIGAGTILRLSGLGMLVIYLVAWLMGRGVSPPFLMLACMLVVVPGLLRAGGGHDGHGAPIIPVTLEVEDMGHRAPNRIPSSRPPAPPPPAPMDRLAETVRAWLADPRPAWETVEAFERDVERVLGKRSPFQ